MNREDLKKAAALERKLDEIDEAAKAVGAAPGVISLRFVAAPGDEPPGTGGCFTVEVRTVVSDREEALQVLSILRSGVELRLRNLGVVLDE